MTVILPFGRATLRQTLPRSNYLLTRLASSNPILRVSCIESDYPADSQLCYRQTLKNSLAFTVRGYATEAAPRSTTKPKAHTGRTTAKRTTTKSKSTTAAKSVKKPAKKPAKKVVKKKTKTTAKAKPKAKPRAKRPLSKHAIDQARIAKTKELKAKALLTEPKQLPAAAWSVYFSENQKNAHNIAEGAEKTKEIARNYHTLSAEEREVNVYSYFFHV